jgi:iron complex transport system ATP-binding protein
MAAVGLADFAARYLPTLSGGEHRRVEIAALLTQNPPISLLDEPTNHLDLHYQVLVLKLLSQRAFLPSQANLFVLHDVNLAIRFCNHGLLLFGDGDCVFGRLDEVLNLTNLERLYRCPMREMQYQDTRLFFPA